MIIAPVAIIADEAWYLLQVKDQQHPAGGCGLWSLFGGRQEPGETPEEALLRELDEELRWRPRLEDLGSPLPDVQAEDGQGLFWAWRPYLLPLAAVPLSRADTLTEGHSIRVSAAGLRRAVEMEGKPLQRGRNRGAVQRLFMPGIADVFRQHLTFSLPGTH